MSKRDPNHVYFTCSTTNAQPHEERVAVHFSEAGKVNDDGRITSMSMIWPGLIVSDAVAEPESFAKDVAKVLNENAGRFFSSAAKPNPYKDMNLKPHEELILTERDELRAKTSVLADFLGGEIFPTLPDEERELLQIQLACMSQYELALTRRAALFQSNGGEG